MECGHIYWRHGRATENARPDIARPDNAEQDKQWFHCPLAVRIDCCLYCRSNSDVRARLNRTCWTISELNPVCHDSTAALTVDCSFFVQSAILSALIRSPYTPAGQQQQQQQQQRGQDEDRWAPVPAATTSKGVEIGNGNRGNNLGRLLRNVSRGATCWLRTGAVWTYAVQWSVCYACVS